MNSVRKQSKSNIKHSFNVDVIITCCFTCISYDAGNDLFSLFHNLHCCKLVKISKKFKQFLTSINRNYFPMTSKVTSDSLNSLSLFYFFYLFLHNSYNIVSICNFKFNKNILVARRKQQQNNAEKKN